MNVEDRIARWRGEESGPETDGPIDLLCDAEEELRALRAATGRVENQRSITRWANEEFGIPSSLARVAARVNEEMSELLRSATAIEGERAARIEAALRNLVGQIEELSDDITDAAETDRAWEEVWARKLAAEAALAPADYSPVLKEAADVAIVMARLGSMAGGDIDQEVDRKMAVNRARRWEKDGTGHGYHVRDKAATP